MSNFLVQIIRTVVPMAVGFLFTWLLAIGIELPEGTKAELTSFLVLFSSSLYYISVAALEKKFPAFGWLLGVARNPVYASKEEVAIIVPTTSLNGGK